MKNPNPDVEAFSARQNIEPPLAYPVDITSHISEWSLQKSEGLIADGQSNFPV